LETRRGGRLVDRPEFKTKPKPVTFLGKDKVSQAIAVMADKNYGSVVIVDSKDKVVGIVTERDIVKKLVNNNMSPKTTKLEDIMTLNPRVANENDDVVDWLRTMSNDRFRRLPVVDADGKIKVIFTQGDFVSYTWPDLIFQASQLAKASFMKGFSINTLLIFMVIYGVALIAAMKAFL
jgi:CBS domain-containing protein